MKIVSYNVTKKCNLYCEHCYRNSKEDVDLSDELSTEEAKEVFRDIKKAGFNMLKLSGGEPLMREDIFELAEFASSLGLYTCLGTNGTLINEDNIGLIKKYIRSVAISIDSRDKNVHDSFRGYEGAFDETMRGIDILKENEVKFQINTTISKINLKEIKSLLDFASELGASSVHVLFLVMTGRGKNLENVYLTKEEYTEAIKKVLEYESDLFIKPTCAPQSTVLAKKLNLDPRVKKSCIAGTSYCSLVYDGRVNICPYAEVEAGNVKEDSFYNIWNNSEVFKKLRDPSSYKGRCRTCNFNNICGGCRARAFANTGDYLEFDNYCVLGD